MINLPPFIIIIANLMPPVGKQPTFPRFKKKPTKQNKTALQSNNFRYIAKRKKKGAV